MSIKTFIRSLLLKKLEGYINLVPHSSPPLKSGGNSEQRNKLIVTAHVALSILLFCNRLWCQEKYEPVSSSFDNSFKKPLMLESPELKHPVFLSNGSIIPSTPFRYGITGYIKNESFFDSRQVVADAQDQFLLYPRKPRPDRCGRDINNKGHFNMLAIESRIRGEIAGPKIFGADTYGVGEADAWGIGSDLTIARIRLRHAFMYFAWQKRSLLMGQYWHPVFVTECFPDTISFNNGVPIEPFTREPQIRWTQKFGSMTLILAACSRAASLLDGPPDIPETVEASQIRNGIMPNLHMQIHSTVSNHAFGIAIDATRLVPRLATDNDSFRAKESLISYLVFGFASLNWSELNIKLKAIYAQNGYGYGMISGYAVHCIDPYTKERVYTNTQCVAGWADIYYTHPKIIPGCFIGYTKNIGANKSVVIDPTIKTFFSGNQEDIDYVFRCAPRVRWLKNPFILGVEFEWTRAAFGIPTTSGRVRNAHSVDNLRAMLATYYVF